MKEKNPTVSKAPAILKLIRRLQQKNRFVTLDIDFPLTIIQSFILLEIASGRNSARALAELFGVDQSTMSRNLSNLGRLGYIEVKKTKADSRRKILALSSKGQSFQKDYDSKSNALIATYSVFLDLQERQEFTTLFRKFNDDLGCPVLESHKGDKPWRLETRRIVFGLKFFSESFMESSLNIAEWQVLSELAGQARPLSQSEVSRITGVAQTSLPALISRLAKRKMLRVQARKNDARSRDLVLLAKGSAEIRKVGQQFTARIESALCNFSQQESSRFVELFELYSGEDRQARSFVSRELVLAQIYDSDLLRSVRTLLLENLSGRGELCAVPPRIFDSQSESFAIFDRFGTLAGGLEILREESAVALINLFTSVESDLGAVLDNCRRIVAPNLKWHKKYSPSYLEHLVL